MEKRTKGIILSIQRKALSCLIRCLGAGGLGGTFAGCGRGNGDGVAVAPS